MLKKVLRFTGLAAFALAWITVFLSIQRNTWFNFFKHALSDLGGPRAVDPWIYNVGLVATGAMASVYGVYLALVSTSKASIYASSFVFIAGIFLALVGVFPSGTRPHVFVSTWFFVQAWMAMLASAIDFLAKKEVTTGAVLLSLSVIGPVGALLIRWPSVALLEVYGVILIGVYIVTLTKRY